MRLRRKWRVGAPLLLWILVVFSYGVNAATLNKCCDFGQALEQVSGGEAICKPYIDDEDWLPIIFTTPPQGGFAVGKLNEKVIIANGTRPVCANGKPPTFIHSPKDYPIFGVLNNSLSLIMLHSLSKPENPEQFCVDRHSALVCTEPINHKKVRKCCGTDAAYSFTNSSCVFGTHFNHNDLKNIAPGYGFPICDSGPSGGTLIVVGEIEGNLTAVVDKENGSLQLAPPPSRALEVDEYCLDTVIERPESVVNVLACAPPPKDPERRPTWPGAGGQSLDLRFTLYPAALAISAFFLAATLATGCLLPKAHHALHWRCQTCHVACLLVGDVLLAVVQLAGPALPPPACRTIAVMMHFFFLAAFFWLNAMCFNIWWTFRDLRPMSADPGQERFRYRAYSVYAWGGPLLVSGVAILLDVLEQEFTAGLLRPRFGDLRCWFYGDWEIFAFFHGPVGVLLILNLVLFAATTRELTCGLWRRDGVKSASGGGGGGGAHGGTSPSERSTLSRVCIKLVVVMGVTWIADVISWAVGGPAYVWFVTDLVNALQGVFIFIVVGCQPQVWAAVKRLWWCSRGSTPTQGSTAANPMSCSSQGVPSTVAVEGSSPSMPPPIAVDPPLETPC